MSEVSLSSRGSAGERSAVDGKGGRRRVLHVITRLDRGGSAENTLLTVAYLDPARYELILATGPSQPPLSATLDLARERGVQVVDVPSLIRSPHPWHDLKALVQLRRLMEGVDLLHTHTSKAGILGRLAGRLAGVPHVVHTPHGHVFYGYYPAAVTRLFVWLERLAARWCDRIIALTPADRDDHLDFRVASASHFDVIHSGVDLAALDATAQSPAQTRASLGIPEDAFVVGTLGRLTAIKGQADLVRAVALLSQPAWLLLVGDGEEEELLKALSVELGISERVVFAGWREDKGDLLRAMDLFAFPSLNEGMGKALVEAMYVERPVVATRVGGVPELVEDGMHGVLVPPADPPALAAAIEALRNDRPRARTLALAGAQRAVDFGVEPMVRRIDDLYQSLLADEGA